MGGNADARTTTPGAALPAATLPIASALGDRREDPLDLLFSDPDALAARFYDSSPVMTYHNETAALLLRNMIAD
ncbi:hypothetical protein [Streptomyces klenkii]